MSKKDQKDQQNNGTNNAEVEGQQAPSSSDETARGNNKETNMEKENNNTNDKQQPAADNKKDHGKAAASESNPNKTNGAQAADDTCGPRRFSIKNQNFPDQVGVQKVLRCACRKIDKQEFIRQFPPGFTEDVYILKYRDGAQEDIHVVAPHIAPYLPKDIIPARLHAVTNTQSVIFLTPVKLPAKNGRTDRWAKSLVEGLEYAAKRWVRIVANTDEGAYDILLGSETLSEPEFPKVTFDELFKLAFKDKIIDSLEHPIIQKLLKGTTVPN